MKQEDKELLLKDLCARLPYLVIVHIKGEFHESHILEEIDVRDRCVRYFENMHLYEKRIEDCKPYLRPMSSMTLEEKIELCTVGYAPNEMKTLEEKLYVMQINAKNATDFFNEYHFDYRGLIEKGLALEAPDGMYNIKEK